MVAIFRLTIWRNKMNNITKVLVISVSALAIASCSSMKHKGAQPASTENSAASAFTSGMAPNGEITGTEVAQKRVCAPCTQAYYFDFDQDVIHPEDMKSIHMQANYLLTHPKAKVRLAGNTDERGSKEYNVALGWRRAQSVANILQQDGVAKRQIVTISYGEEKPVAFGHSEDSWHLNRRVDLTYIAK
jgi:peptidoglycan-associated lipoprotein